MLNFLWAFMILAGIIYAAFSGNIASVTDAALESAQQAVTLCITMAGIMAFWVGMMRIAENAGIMKKAAEKTYPLLHFVFPRIPKEHPACKSISANCIANFFGLGWAATPAGLQAMKDLDLLERERVNVPKKTKVASTEMCSFLVINISSLQLIPVTVIAYRSQYGSPNPTGIVGMAIVATAISTIVGVVFIKIMSWWDTMRGY